MEYQQQGRLLVPISKQVIPISDLGLSIGGVGGLNYPDDLPPVLAINVIQTPTGPRIIQGDSLGHILQTLSTPQRVVLVPPRTDTTTFTSGDFTTPSFTVALFTVRATAVAGTTPSMTVLVQGKDSQGVYSGTNGGAAFTALTAAGVASQAVSTAINSSALMIPPLFRVNATITGTTPSFTWYLDMIYK